MNRLKELKIAAYNNDRESSSDVQQAFVEGAIYADENPVTNINWMKPEELNDFSSPLLCWTSNGKCLTFKTCRNNENHWKFLVEKYNITHVVLQSEIAPK